MTDFNQFDQPVGAIVQDSFPRPLPDRSVMRGRYCTLAPMVPDHTEALFNAFAQSPDARHWTYLPLKPFQVLQDAQDFVDGAAQSRDPLYFTVLDPNGIPVGWASYLRIKPQDGSIEVGWINFSTLMQGSRMSTEAMYLMMRHVFDDLGYRRYEWKCNALNAPSRAAAERLGFRYEGTFRQATHVHGRNRDTAWFSILDHEWPAQKPRFEAWLQPSNFDAEGRQVARLHDVRL